VKLQAEAWCGTSGGEDARWDASGCAGKGAVRACSQSLLPAGTLDAGMVGNSGDL